MISIISWTFIVIISFIGLFFLATSIYALCHKKWKAGSYCISLSGIAFSLEANPLRNMFELSQTFFDSLMWVLAICAIGLFITVVYDWISSSTKA